MDLTPDIAAELEELVDALQQDVITPSQSARLEELLTSSEPARQYYLRLTAIYATLRWPHGIGGPTTPVSGWALAPGDPPARSVSEESTPHAPREVDHHAERDEYSKARSAREGAAIPIPASKFPVLKAVVHPITLLALALIAVIGTLAYTFSSKRIDPPVAAPNAESFEPAATLVRTTDAQWMGPFALAQGRALRPGQRLVLERGSAEITFSSQARVIFEGPADFTIVDAMACRLSGGRLTAHVPGSAKGFTVHTPDGSVKDLGTEFGVYVRDQAGGNRQEAGGEEEREQPAPGPQPEGTQPPVTEVHVFKGKVDVAQRDQLGQTTTSPPSPLAPRPSTILSAGEAIVISENKVQPLPAADPFKFALDKLAGQPRKVLFTEDFESYDLGRKDTALGPWIVQSGLRKGQGVFIYDPAERLESHFKQTGQRYPNLSPPPPVGKLIAHIAASGPNPRNTFPLLACPIDGRQLTKDCQVLIEFDIFPDTTGFQTSLTLATEIGRTGGIELFRDADEARKIEWPPYQWYRLRLLLDVVGGAAREVRAERFHWLGPQGWVRDLTYQPAAPKLAWPTPPRYVIFGYPAVTPATPATIVWLDNVRIEVISEK